MASPPPERLRRTCLHCILGRVLRSEVPKFEAVGLSVMIGHLEPLWLPLPAPFVYRSIRRLLRSARVSADRPRVRVTVVNMLGKAHVEVLVPIRCGRDVRVLTTAFARHVAGTLDGGFTEGLLSR
jgi:hypothetical protein